jgi:hypothetical protein
MGTKTIIILCLVTYGIYSKNKPIKAVNFNSFLQKGGDKRDISFIK